MPAAPNRLLARLVAEIEDFQARVRELPVAPSVAPRAIREHLARYDFAHPRSLGEVFGDVVGMMRRWTMHTTHPRQFGLYNPSVGLGAVVADALVALYNPQLAVWASAPAAVEIEQHVLAALGARLGLDPAATAAAFTSGGAESNLSAVVVALAHAFPGYARGGLAALGASGTRPVFYLSQEGHHSFAKAAVVAGLGRDALREVAADPRSLRMDPADLARRVREDRAAGLAPFLVVATAGTTNAGAVDPLPALADLCAREGLWLHVDAAWAGAAALSARLAPVLAGIARADSITWDAHKWLSVPMGAGMFFCRHREAVKAAFAVETPYMPKGTDGDRVNPFTSSLQWSRRFIGLKVFLSLAELGFPGYERRIDQQAALGDYLRERLRDAGWTILNDTPLPVVCFTHAALAPGPPRSPGTAGAPGPRDVLAYLYRHQTAWISETRLLGTTPALRACITSFRSEREDVDALIDGLHAALADLRARAD